MFGYFKRKREEREGYKKGQKAAEENINAINDYINDRVMIVARSYLQILKNQLVTIYSAGEGVEVPDDLPLTELARINTRAHWNIFREQTEAFPDRMHEIMENELSSLFEFIDLTESRNMIDQFVQQQLKDISQELLMAGTKEIAYVIGEIEERERRALSVQS